MREPKSIPFNFSLQNDGLQIRIVDRQLSVWLRKVAVPAPANVSLNLEILIARGIDDAGKLLLTRHDALKFSEGAELVEPTDFTQSLNDAKVYRAAGAGLRKFPIEELSEQFAEPKPVVVLFQKADAINWRDTHFASTDPSPQSDISARLTTLGPLLQAGTLVFEFQAGEDLPLP